MYWGIFFLKNFRKYAISFVVWAKHVVGLPRLMSYENYVKESKLNWVETLKTRETLIERSEDDDVTNPVDADRRIS